MSKSRSPLFRLTGAIVAASILLGLVPLGVSAGPSVQREWTPTPPRETLPPPPPPQNTRAPTRVPTKTPTPTATRPPTPTFTPTPTRVLADSPVATLFVQGCDPAPSDISVRFQPLGMLGAQDAFGPTGSVRGVGVRAGGTPGVFVFPPIRGEAGRLYEVRVAVDSPECDPPTEREPEYWTPGDALIIQIIAALRPELLGSNLGGQAPGYKGEIYSGVWVDTVYYYGSLQGRMQVFEWQDKLGADSGLLQASVFPFEDQGDPQTPGGLVKTWDVNCANCVFTVDLSALAAYQPTQPKQDIPTAKAGQGNGFAKAIASLIKIVSTGVNEVLTLVGIKNPFPGAGGQSTGQGNQLSQGGVVEMNQKGPLLAMPDFYFRVVPRKGSNFIAPVSTTVRLHWDGDQQPPLDMDLSCLANPNQPTCPPTPTPAPKPYIIDIIAYHGWIEPTSGHEGCYIVTKTTTVQVGFNPLTYEEGTKLCKPPPKKKGLLDVLGDLLVEGLGAVSAAYNSLQDAVVSLVANFIPSGLCDNSCLKTLLKVGLAAIGLPPSIPNFAEVLNGGMDYFSEYLAEQAVASVGIPPEVTKGLTGAALDAAKEEFKKQLQEQIKQGLQDGLEQMEYALSESVSYVPDGVPVKADPLGDYQMPMITLRITRDPAVPESADTCKGSTPYLGKSNIALMPLVTAKVSPTGGKFSSGPDLKDGQQYPLYEQKGLPLPDLALGESIEFPVVLKPAILWGVPGGYNIWSEASQAWSVLYYNGVLSMSATNPCAKGDSISLPAVQSY